MAPNNNNPVRSSRCNSRGGMLLCVCLVGVFLLGGCVKESVLVDRKALADGGKFIVLPLSDAPGEQADGSGGVVTGAIAAQMLQEPNVKLFDVGSAKLKKALEESGFDAMDISDPAVAAELARKLGAQFVVTGEVMHYAPEKQASAGALWIFQGGGTTSRYWVCLHLRIVQASNGKIVYAGEGTAVSQEGYAPAAEQACEQAFKQLDNILRGKNQYGL